MNKLLILLAFFSTACFSQWQLDAEKSEVSFVSTKNLHFREVHRIQQISATIAQQSKVTIELDLSSIESGIPIRNERMKTMLFDVANTKTATLSFTLPVALDSLEKVARYPLTALLSLHGKSQEVTLDMLLTPAADSITGTLATPVIINAADFGLVAGIDALQKVAGLSSIGHSVPVSATLVLTKS
ncbi:YceI family protein [Planctobacterium marinum]|uniref:Lipid/polyisoprenoid-binding YceI-like domain-containing protein n=1 Tax=Planctobacterium marinum TaxID=1631968 RepID=A0AA48HU22_9ALTE|nr:hypothetical protein MACH26_01060 [Planctobacterium marinum]